MPKNLAETLTAQCRTVNFLKTGGDSERRILGGNLRRGPEVQWIGTGCKRRVSGTGSDGRCHIRAMEYISVVMQGLTELRNDIRSELCLPIRFSVFSATIGCRRFFIGCRISLSAEEGAEG